MKIDTSLTNNKELESRRKELRKNMTPAERKLWLNLKNKQMDGVKFRRQVSIGYFIVDFYSFEKNLVIELDGYHHFTEEGKAYDEERDVFMESRGIKVLRFKNAEVIGDVGEGCFLRRFIYFDATGVCLFR